MLEIEMPHDDDVERAVLGVALFDANAAQDICGTVTPADFYTPANKIAFQAVLNLNKVGKVADLVSVTNELRTTGAMETVGGMEYLMAVSDAVFTSANVGHYCTALQDLAARRRLIKAAIRIAEGASAGGNVADLIEKAEAAVCSVGNRRRGSQSRHVSQVLSGVYLAIEKRYDGEEFGVVNTRLPDLDRLLGGGFRESELIIVAGRPGMGKSALCGDAAAAVAGDQNKPVVVFTMEMSDSQLAQRLLARQARINGLRLQLGQVFDHEWDKLRQAIGTMNAWPLALNDCPDMSPMQMRAECRRIQQDMGQLGLVIVDYLGLLDSDHQGSGDNRVQEVSKITRALKKLAKEFKVPVMALSQLSRQVESRTNKRPMLSDLRESGSVEQDADKVLFLYRDEYYNPESDQKGLAEVIVAKHRSGPVGTVKALYNKDLASFEPLGLGTYTPDEGHGYKPDDKRMPADGHWTDK